MSVTEQAHEADGPVCHVPCEAQGPRQPRPAAYVRRYALRKNSKIHLTIITKKNTIVSIMKKDDITGYQLYNEDAKKRTKQNGLHIYTPNYPISGTTSYMPIRLGITMENFNLTRPARAKRNWILIGRFS